MLQTEEDLMEIVQLVGKDSLAEADKVRTSLPPFCCSLVLVYSLSAIPFLLRPIYLVLAYPLAAVHLY